MSKKDSTGSEKLPVSLSKSELNDSGYWEDHIEKWSHSGLTQSEYCRQHNLPYNMFRRWKRNLDYIYPQETLDRYFTWEKMRTMNEDPHLIALKGVPLPLKFKPWWALVEQAQ